jgi:anaerobic selenocysteine-containing dehydrogenase
MSRRPITRRDFLKAAAAAPLAGIALPALSSPGLAVELIKIGWAKGVLI